jgi:hypothetical protein
MAPRRSPRGRDWLWFPVFAQTREHARFPELLERVGLVAYWRAKNR